MVDAILNIVFKNLNSLIQEEIGLVSGTHKEMEKLSKTVSIIRGVLEEAETKQLKDKAIKNWLKQLKDAAYDADDILDDYATEALRSKVESQNKNCTMKVSNSFLSCITSKQLIFGHKIGRRIKEIRERLDKINDERSTFNLRDGVVDKGVEVNERETSSILTEPIVYGRDEDIQKIVQHLLNDVNNYEEVSIYPIIGMGGLGKTTLAQLAYNDERVEKHFELRIWVCVSEAFDVKRLLKETIESAGGNTSDLINSALDPLQSRLRDILSGKRFLLVLDDVWNEDHEKWDKLKHSLTCGGKGSSIIVTTRIVRVASIMDTLHAHHLLPLSEEDCWSLFKQRAFGMGNEENLQLVAIGKEIVKKCGGVPLAAKALGSIMRFKNEEIEWLFVRDSEIWDLPEDEVNFILPALRLSYNHLPSYLKQCFSYCSIFPKDYSMEKKELIHLWMANGFIQSKGRMLLEDIGNGIFNDLLWRSFFQNIEKDNDGNIVRCKIHDLMHDLACSIMVDECCSIVDIGTPENLPKRIRHLSLIDDPVSSITLELPLKFQTIRTLGLLQSYTSSRIKVPDSIFLYLKCIRVLDLSQTFISDLPVSIGKMKHLRYLNLSGAKMTALPESVSSLINLQILKLKGCYWLQKLPKYTRNMRSLRHLDISKCKGLTHMPVGMGQLIDLQTLSIFIVGKKKGCHIKELQGLNHLRGVEIKQLENVRNSREAKEANLIRKQNLCSLDLYWGLDGENSEEVLEGLQPHQSISRLTIKGYGGVTFPSWMGDPSLLNLVEIILTNWKRCEHLPPIGQLPHLKVLHLREWDCVKYIGNEFYGEGMVKGFPTLEGLYLYKLSNLEEWSTMDAGEVLPCIRKLIVEDCPMLTSLPLLPCLEHLEVVRGNEVILRSLGNLTSLSSLLIKGFHDMISFSEGVLQNLTALQSLEFFDLPNLATFPREIENLASLASLKILYCGGLVSLPVEFGSLTSLKSMFIMDCNALKSLPEEGIQGLCSLVSLRISDCNSLTSLSKGLPYLTSLEELSIGRCLEVESLPSEDLQQLISLRDLDISTLPKLTNFTEGLQHLTSLRSLKIYHCENLTLLPEGLQNLTALQYLSISKCPHLERRYERERGEDWHKIAHIPDVRIRYND